MIYPILGAIISSAALFYVGKETYGKQQQTKVNSHELIAAQIETFDSFLDYTIEDPIIRKEFQNVKVLYSRYFNAPLVIHEYITYQQKNNKIQLNKSIPLKQSNLTSKQIQTWKQIILHPRVHQGIWITLDRYAHELVRNKKCQSVDVYSGPIYSKDKAYQHQDQEFSQIYSMKFKVLKDGNIVPDKVYKIIKCNTKQTTYFNAFSLYNNGRDTINQKIIDMIRPINQIQIQTGIKFKIKGKALTQLDFDTIRMSRASHQMAFHSQRLAGCQHIKDIYQVVAQAQQQGVQLTSVQNKIIIQQKVIKQLQKMQQNLKQLDNGCQSLAKMLKLNKHLSYLNKMGKLTQTLQKIQQQSLTQCLSSRKTNPLHSYATIKQIKQMVLEGYTFINPQLIHQL